MIPLVRLLLSWLLGDLVLPEIAAIGPAIFQVVVQIAAILVPIADVLPQVLAVGLAVLLVLLRVHRRRPEGERQDRARRHQCESVHCVVSLLSARLHCLPVRRVSRLARVHASSYFRNVRAPPDPASRPLVRAFSAARGAQSGLRSILPANCRRDMSAGLWESGCRG